MEYFNLFIVLFLLLPFLAKSTDEEKKVHIVLLGDDDKSRTAEEIEDQHHSYLLSVKENEEDAKSSILYSYKNIGGFAALLTPHEALKLSEMEGVVSVFRSHGQKYTIHTTRSWEFSSLHMPMDANDKDNLWLKSKYGNDVIIGMLDTGIWPESQSFSDDGMEAVPKSWKGVCQHGDTFNSSTCNRKIVGARYYLKGFEAEYGPLNRTFDSRSARDMLAHGTLTSSIAAGRRVDNVSSPYGFARGTATGGAPLARLAIYKVIWLIGEYDTVLVPADSLAAVDDAISDGVHILSMSYGSDAFMPLNQDLVSAVTLHAAKANIVIAASAGDDGPDPATVVNLAPWLITVGSSIIDRKFTSNIVLGTGLTIPGESMSKYKLENKFYRLVSADQVINSGVPKNESRLCLEGSLSPPKVKGKIVLCSTDTEYDSDRAIEVKRAGGIGVILGNCEADGNPFFLPGYASVIPITTVGYTNALNIRKYIKTAKKPTAKIASAKTILGTKPAPIANTFSSRGPNAATPYILKPDITAPGDDILAAWSEASRKYGDVKYGFRSSTSMACPHVAGAMALLKAVHPDWSSAAVRSALMTTAGQLNNEGNPITTNYNDTATPFMIGSGYFNPTKAVDPGLVYNASYNDYLLFLCSIGIHNISSTKCPDNPPPPYNLNYPSLAIPDLKGTVTVVRTVTNVGGGKGVYLSKVQSPQGILVQIQPRVLNFVRAGEKKSFTITVKTDSAFSGIVGKGEYLFGWYSWSDGIHVVRSPMAISVL
ncbi:subtilase family protein [Striga hermonthica]|uniref:Subtilase family protein n=1 Tax=Striga hermonthica TaxID=68872 RepID=A0A9N7NK40_STRHE|nr:subtilase family protein [Striga hermonthica]